MVGAFVKTHKLTIRLDDSAYNKTKVRLLLLLRVMKQQPDCYLGLRELADLGAASYGYLKGRMKQLERWRYVYAKPVEGKGKAGLYWGYRIAPKGDFYLKNCERYHPERVAELIAELDITVVRG